MKLYLLFVLCTVSITAYLQEDTIISPKKKIKFFPTDLKEKKWRFLFGLDARRSFYRGNHVKINGIRIGAEFKGAHRFGIGFYSLNRNVIFHDIPVDHADAMEPHEVHFNLGYTSIFYERVFIRTRFWEVSFPVHFAGGNIRGMYRDTLSAMQPLVHQTFSAILHSVQVKFYPLKWLYIRAAGGYRLTFNTVPEVKETFNRPFYGYGLGIEFRQLYTTLFGTKEERQKRKDKKRQEKESINHYDLRY